MVRERYNAPMTNGRYLQLFTLTMVAYAVLLVVAIEYVRTYEPSMPIKAVFGLLPVMPLAFLIKIQMDRYRSLDELEQRILSESIVFAFACTAMAVITYGFMQSFLNAPAINWLWVWPVQGGFWLIGRFVASRRYSK